MDPKESCTDSFAAAVRRAMNGVERRPTAGPAGYGAVIDGAWREFDTPEALMDALRRRDEARGGG